MLRNQSNPAIPILGPRLCYDMTKASGKRENLHYPPNTKAFLYYFKSPDKPRIAGELRFRVASSDDHVAFQSGFDLLKPNGQLWSRPLHVVSKSYTPLYENMRGDRLIPDDLDANLSTLPPLSPRYRRCQTLYTLNDRFTIDFSTDQHFCVVTEQGVETLHLLRQFVERQFVENQEKRRLPYKGAYSNVHLSIDSSNESVGSFLAQFERSTLPDHKDSRTVVLRFLKVIQPVEYEIPDYEGRIAQPEEGELYQRSYKSIPKVWSVDIDQKGILSRSLQLLWDA